MTVLPYGTVELSLRHLQNIKLPTIDLFTDTAAILNSIVLTEKLWAAEGAIAGKFIVYTAFRINFYCLSLIFHNKYYKRYIFPSRYLAVVPMVIEKLLTARPWAERGSCSARGFFFFVFVSPDADLRG